MREGIPYRAARHEGVHVREVLRDMHACLEERMKVGGYKYTMNENDESLSLQADADNFGPLLANLEELLAEVHAGAHKGEHHLSIVVRGMHAIEVRATHV